MKNNFCRHLSLDVLPDIRIMDFLKNKKYSSEKNFIMRIPPNIDILNFLKKLNLTCNQARIFYTPPHGSLDVHVDAENILRDKNFVDAKNNQYTHTVKINWVFGAANSTMSWWKPIDESGVGQILKTSVGSPYIGFNENKCIKVWSENITDPCLLNVGQPHSVENTTDEQRWCFSYAITDVDPEKILTWEDACERLKDYIK